MSDNKTTKFAIKLSVVACVTLGVSIAAQSLIAAWQAPTATPPGSNLPKPLNVSSDAQQKAGMLTLNTDGNTNAVIIDSGNLNINGDGNIHIDDSGGTTHVIGDEDSGESDGIVLRTLSNPTSGEPIFVVESSGNSQRLRVEHDGYLSTSNSLDVSGATGESYIRERLNMEDNSVGGPNNQGVRSVNFENHESGDFSCADNDDVAGNLWYDRSEGLILCRQGTKEGVSCMLETHHEGCSGSGEACAADCDNAPGSGWILIGGGCKSSHSWAEVQESRPASGNRWYCEVNSGDANATALCVRYRSQTY